MRQWPMYNIAQEPLSLYLEVVYLFIFAAAGFLGGGF